MISQQTKKAELKTLITLFIPAVLSQLALMATIVTDTLMAGNYSTDSLAAISLASYVLQPMAVFVVGIFVALNPMVSQLNGKEQFTHIKQTLEHGLLLACALFLPCALFLWQFEWFISFFNIEQKIIGLTQSYLKAISWGLLPYFLFLAFRFFNEGLFMPKVVMFMNLMAIPLNILLNWLLIYGHWGFPELGTQGIGYATSIVWLAMFLGILLFNILSKSTAHLNLFQSISRFDGSIILETLKIGLPIGLSLFLEIGMFAAMGFMVAGMGISTIAGHQLAMNISSVLFMIPLGVSIALTSRVGYYHGKSLPAMVGLVSKIGVTLCIGLAALNIFIMVVLAKWLLGFYTSDVDVIAIGSSLLLLAAIYQFSDSMQVVCAGILRGLKDTTIPMYINIFSYWVIGVPLAYVLALLLGFGVSGLWWGMAIGLTCSALLMWRRLVAQKLFTAAKDHQLTHEKNKPIEQEVLQD